MNPKLNLKSLLFILTTLVSIQIPGFFCQDQPYETCRQPFQCGNIETSYPFWGGDRPISCGYPGFELNCQDDVPYIDISSTSYRVLEINNTTQTLRIARQDLWNNLCPTFLYNTTLDLTIFSFSSTSNDQTINLYYGCALSQTAPTAVPYQFDCNVNRTRSLSVYTTRGEAGSGVSCSRNVSVPVNGAAARDLENPVTSSLSILQAALVSGFWVDWSARNQNCEDCVRSGGFCGYNQNSAAFACYCSDQPYAFTCEDTRPRNGNDSNRRGMYIGFPIAGAVLAGVALGFLVFYCKKQRKQRGAAKSAKIVSKEITPPPSSQSLESPPSTAFTKSIPSYPSTRTDFGKDSSYFGAKLFDYAELEEATDNFNASRELGEGGFGVVYYGMLSDGCKVAVKCLYENNFRRVEQFKNEVEILTRLRHENLVTLHGCTSRRSRELLLVYEFVPNGTVADHLHGKRSKSALLAWPVRLNIAIETAEALAYLHKSDIIHRDVKTNNILLDNGFHVKVADFGLSRLFPIDVTHVSTAPQGTPGYVDPEYYQCYQLTEKSDVYSFGVVLIELISSLPAVDTNRHRHDINLGNMAINRIQNHTVHELVDPSLGFETNSTVRRMVTLVVELAFRCLQHERDVRPSMDEVLEGLRLIKNDDLNANKVDIVDILVD